MFQEEMVFELGPEAKERAWCEGLVEKGICPKRIVSVNTHGC